MNAQLLNDINKLIEDDVVITDIKSSEKGCKTEAIYKKIKETT